MRWHLYACHNPTTRWLHSVCEWQERKEKDRLHTYSTVVGMHMWEVTYHSVSCMLLLVLAEHSQQIFGSFSTAETNTEMCDFQVNRILTAYRMHCFYGIHFHIVITIVPRTVSHTSVFWVGCKRSRCSHKQIILPGMNSHKMFHFPLFILGLSLLLSECLNAWYEIWPEAVSPDLFIRSVCILIIIHMYLFLCILMFIQMFWMFFTQGSLDD